MTLKGIEVDGELGEKLGKLLEGLHAVVKKKEPVLIVKLTPDELARWNEAIAHARKCFTEAKALLVKGKTLQKRLMLDLDEAYSLHGKSYHVHCGALYEGCIEDADHKEKDPAFEENE